MDYNRLWDYKAEGALLGSMLHDPDVIDQVIEVLPDTEAFFRLEHRLIFDALLLMFIERAKIDAVTLHSFLRGKGWLKDIGESCALEGDAEIVAVEYIGRILQSVPSAANARYYAGLVADKWEYRKLIVVSEKIQKILNEYKDTSEMAQEMQAVVMDLQPKEYSTDFQRLDPRQEIESMLTAEATIETGFRDLDKVINFQPGDLVIVAGRPSMGKSCLAVNMVEQMAKYKHVGLIVSLETKREMITQRIIARRARVNRRFITGGDRERLSQAAEELSELPVFVADRVGSLPSTLSLIRRLKQRQGLEVVCVDYLQLMTGARTENRNQEISTITRSLKQAAVESNVLMIVVSQLSRKVEDRADKRPHLADLRDSGSIEQDADWVLLLYRADYYRDRDKPKDGLAEVIIAKARDGETGTVEMVFVPEYTSFETLSRVEEPDKYSQK